MDEFKEKYKLNFSCYATPAEGLSDKFTKLDEKYIGSID
jgi:ribonucleoside-triphosphate reductase